MNYREIVIKTCIEYTTCILTPKLQFVSCPINSSIIIQGNEAYKAMRQRETLDNLTTYILRFKWHP